MVMWSITLHALRDADSDGEPNPDAKFIQQTRDHKRKQPGFAARLFCFRRTEKD